MNARFRGILASALFGASLITGLLPASSRAADWELLEVNRQSGAVATDRTNVFRVRLAPAGKGPVIVDLELKDMGGRRVAQAYIPSAGKEPEWFTIASPLLPPGTYYLSVGVFSRDWKTMLAWFDRTSVFTVYEKSPCGGDCRVALKASEWDGERFTATLENRNAASAVLIDLELYDARNRKLAQKFWNVERLDAKESRTYSMDAPGGLPPGDYYWSVGVFSPHWASMAGWYHAVKKFTVE